MQIDHNFSEFNLSGNMTGTIFMPMEDSEFGLATKGSIRDFSILFNRMYDVENLNDVQNLTVTKYYADDDYEDDNEDEGTDKNFLHFKLTVQKDGLENIQNEFFKELFKLVAVSDKRGIRGKRLAFIQDMEEKNSPYGEVLTFNVLISKNIFFNDYRVTMGFPKTLEEESELLEYIFTQLSSKFPGFGIDIDSE